MPASQDDGISGLLRESGVEDPASHSATIKFLTVEHAKLSDPPKEFPEDPREQVAWLKRLGVEGLTGVVSGDAVARLKASLAKVVRHFQNAFWPESHRCRVLCARVRAAHTGGAAGVC